MVERAALPVDGILPAGPSRPRAVAPWRDRGPPNAPRPPLSKRVWLEQVGGSPRVNRRWLNLGVGGVLLTGIVLAMTRAYEGYLWLRAGEGASPPPSPAASTPTVTARPSPPAAAPAGAPQPLTLAPPPAVLDRWPRDLSPPPWAGPPQVPRQESFAGPGGGSYAYAYSFSSRAGPGGAVSYSYTSRSGPDGPVTHFYSARRGPDGQVTVQEGEGP